MLKSSDIYEYEIHKNKFIKKIKFIKFGKIKQIIYNNKKINSIFFFFRIPNAIKTVYK